MPSHHDYDADGTVRDAMLDAQEEQREEECKKAGAQAYRQGRAPEANPHARGTPYHGWWFFSWAREADADPKRDH